MIRTALRRLFKQSSRDKPRSSGSSINNIKYISTKKFDKQTNTYTLYTCRHTTTNKCISVGLASLSLFTLYTYLTSEEDEGTKEDTMIIGSMCAVAIVVHAIRMRRSMMSMMVDRSGTSIIFKMYNWFGMGSRFVTYDIQCVQGTRPYLHRRLRMPSVVMMSNGKFSYILYKVGSVDDAEVFDHILKKLPIAVVSYDDL